MFFFNHGFCSKSVILLRTKFLSRSFSNVDKLNGVVLSKLKDGTLSSASEKYLNNFSKSELNSYLRSCSYPKNTKECLVLPQIHLQDNSNINIAVISVEVDDITSSEKAKEQTAEALLEDGPLADHEVNDLKRQAIANGIHSLCQLGCQKISVDPLNHPKLTAETAVLSSYKFAKLSAKSAKPKVDITTLGELSLIDRHQWDEGAALAEGQNFARHLMDLPANVCRPQDFVHYVMEKFNADSSKPEVRITVREEKWLKEQKMDAFLSVAAGASNPPLLLELELPGSSSSGDADHLALVGKGVTFDSGGISIKPSLQMDKMRADMGGAACVVGALFAVREAVAKGAVSTPTSSLRAYIPLCENMPDARATRPGDVVRARCGLSVAVDNTDAEGRLLLLDSLHYALERKPRLIVDLATLTGAVVIALGGQYTALFANAAANRLGASDALIRSGEARGDRFYPMPYARYRSQVRHSPTADLSNIGRPDREAGSCTAAAFLSHAGVHCGPAWMHLDIAGVMERSSVHLPYLGGGGSAGHMSGRPTRALAHFILHEWPLLLKSA